MDDETAPLPIFVFRGLHVVRDADLARAFGYTTGNLNKRVRANAERFGDDFVFQLSVDELADLKFQLGRSKAKGGITKPPLMYTEHGVVMAATLLRTPTAVEASRFVVNTFVEARRHALAQRPGQNRPALLVVDDVTPPASGERHGILGRLDAALGRVLDAIADPVQETTVREEARSIALEGLNAIKARLRKHDIGNEKTLAEIQKLLKEVEDLDAKIAERQVETNHRQLAYQAKQLRIVIEVQRYFSSGDVATLLSVLKDLGE